MPNVLLLVDTSGSMERMPDNTLPSQNRDPLNPPATIAPGQIPNICSPGHESNPNRWGMLLQALTGNFNPFYSCEELSRASNRFKSEYKIGGVNPYDADYFLPYHRPLTGQTTTVLPTVPNSGEVCVTGPHHLPGASPGAGVGPSGYGYTPAGDVTDFPDDAISSIDYRHHYNSYNSGSAIQNTLSATNQCIFDQAVDGQLDAARDYIRLGLMTFDNDVDGGTGVSNPTGYPGLGTVLSGANQPFLGQWSYTRSSSGNPDYGRNVGAVPSILPGAWGVLPACAPTPFEVGARHWGAPPWEGRMVLFPGDDASLFDIQRSNEQIQRVLLATRPFGATPIEGMMDDARDYFWYNANGPKNDRYVAADCRDQFIVLLTDGAPNLDLRPNCEQAGGSCPYSTKAAQTALELWQGTSGKKVTTYVIGFSVNGTNGGSGDGFPPAFSAAPTNTCKDFYAGSIAQGGGNGNPQDMATACATLNPKPGTTAEACCRLNEIAFNGSGGAAGTGDGPFFAESQADIVLSFGKILAAVTKSVNTRTLPGFTPTAFSNASFSNPTSAQFVGSFVPNAQKPWSGELLRDRFQCGSSTCAPGPAPCAEQQTNDASKGDSTAINLATQGAANRLFITVTGDEMPNPGQPAPLNNFIDSRRSMRPFVSASSDGVPVYGGREWGAKDWDLSQGGSPISPAVDLQLAMDIDKHTCKKSKVVLTGTSVGLRGTKVVPALDLDTGDACTDVMWGFETAHASAINLTGTPPGPAYDFNVRCSGSTNAAQGRCSITGVTCNVANPTACLTGASADQVCVPECSAFGALFRASPTVNGPPNAFLRDAGYRDFQGKRKNRRPIVYAATTDGILHALKAVEDQPGAHHELWSFVPPAVLPRIASNYPSGNQVLLDGTPVVSDVVWERTTTDTDSGGALTPGAKWHTSLVAGLGEGGGYYSLNVTDPDCNDPAAPNNGTFSNVCLSAYSRASSLAEASAGAAYDNGAKKGPHFMWQLGDVLKVTGDPAKVTRKAKNGDEMVALFGQHTGTPAIAMLQVKQGAGPERQIGVAILPGGVDGAPEKTGYCPRAFTAADDASPTNVAGYTPRGNVRRWARNCTDPVPGRGVTIVRLDTGEIIRHFGRTQDVPKSISDAGVVKQSPFDSPIVGTPVVYPQITGAVAQKIYVGDADGTLWRIDVSSSDITKWKVDLFADLIPAGGGAAVEAAKSQPIQVPPQIALDQNGNIILNVATGDQESIVRKDAAGSGTSELNYVFSFQDPRPTSASTTRARFNWKRVLQDGERVTGPMTVFDRTLYFTTFLPLIPTSGTCTNGGNARIWGVHYFQEDPGAPGTPMKMYCPKANLNAVTGLCSGGSLVEFEPILDASNNPVGAVVPGVALRASQPCAAQGPLTDELGTGFTSVTPSQFQLVYGVPSQKANGSTFPPSASSNAINRPLPRISTTIQAWSFVTD